MIGFKLFVRDGVEFRKEKTVEYLQLNYADLMPIDAWLGILCEQDSLLRPAFRTYGLTVRLEVNPDIRIMLR